jgi:hypothetical protein
MKRAPVINEPKERLTATLEELMKAPGSSPRRDRNPGAQLVRRLFSPAFRVVARMEKTSLGREALGFLALTLPA